MRVFRVNIFLSLRLMPKNRRNNISLLGGEEEVLKERRHIRLRLFRKKRNKSRKLILFWMPKKRGNDVSERRNRNLKVLKRKNLYQSDVISRIW
jgi:hypothetical protein